MQQSDEFLFQKDLGVVPVGTGMTRQIMGYDQDIMMVKALFEKGSIGALHAHPHVQTTYIASGKFEITIGDKKEILSEGDGFFVPSDRIHGVVCLESGVLIDVFNPVREDFI